MSSRHASRLAALRDLLAAADHDGLLITSLANVRYLTGFSGTNALLLVTAKSAVLLTDFRYATQVRDEVSAVVDVRVEPASTWTGLWQLLSATAGVNRIAFESAHLWHSDFQRLLDQGGRWHWRPTTGMVEGLRERKDDAEVASIQQAIGMAETALAVTLPRVRPGMTETQVAGMLEVAVREAGSEGFPFPTIVASGPRTALPHARAGNRVLEVGDLLLIDFGAIADGYCSDITRTVVLGPASDEQRELYGIVLEANVRASGALRENMPGKAADHVARDYIASRGFGAAFGHSLGHGIGLEVHEGPRLARSVEDAIPVGAVVTVEPGIYREGWGGVRIEDDVLVTAMGPRVLSTFPRHLQELE